LTGVFQQNILKDIIFSTFQVPSIYVKYGYNNSILTADFVLGIILNIGSKINNSRVSHELWRAAREMTDDEITEIKLCKRSKIEEDDYIKVLEHKTGSLF
jgi:octaprenyl-diphosphate synthase